MQRSNRLDNLVLATTKYSEDDVIAELGNKFGLSVIRGERDDVLGRFIDAIERYPSEIAVRITADNPLTDPTIMDRQIEFFIQQGCDYSFTEDIPYGAGVDMFNTARLLEISKSTSDPRCREHINAYFLDNSSSFKVAILRLEAEVRRPDIRVTMDTNKDYERLKEIFQFLGDPLTSGLPEIINAYDHLPDELKN